MFCPNCKAEYRFGFTECSDCGVPLVENLADASPFSSESENTEAAEVLWTGTDSSALSAIAEVLDAVHISYHKTSREVGPLPGLSKPVYAILIHARDRDAARAALDDAQRILEGSGQNANDAAEDFESAPPAPVQPEDSSESLSLPPPDYVPEDFDPEEATTEVWSGEDAAMAQNLRVCLRENGIGCALTKANGCGRLAVLPSDEARAREIIREVVEATPPE